MLQVARRKFELEDVDPLHETPAAPEAALGQGIPSVPAGTGYQTAHRKIKNSQVIDQADEGEIRTFDHTTLDDHYKILRAAKRGLVRPETEPSPGSWKRIWLRMRISQYS